MTMSTEYIAESRSDFAPRLVRSESQTAPPLIELRNVSKVYGTGSAAVLALDQVDLSIGDGEFLVIMGASGSGKSTCLNVLGCLDRPSEGVYSFLGVDTGSLSLDQLALLRRHYIGFVFQGFNLLPRTSALENVELPLLYRGVQATRRHKLAWNALELVGLADRANHAPNELSGGQQQRVAIARAIVTHPAVVLADEPTGNLDSTRSIEILELLRDLNRDRGMTIVMVTHEPEFQEYATRIVTFRDGRIVSDERKEG
jgi:putative ABC transport system ATP-binding protein